MSATSKLVESRPSIDSVLPSTRYFEVDSEAVATRFAVWVTTPAMYDADPARAFPVVYQPDGNKSAPTTTNLLLADDPIAPIEPFIQVQVGYTGADARRMLAVRARDLLPPGEPLSDDSNEDAIDKLVIAGLLTQPDAALYLNNLRSPAGDKFLAFLTEELHPLISETFRVDESQLGLHGYSYGGLFAAWVALQRTIFTRIGAGSPGILPDVSAVITGYRAAAEAGTDFSGRMLHVTVCETELTVPGFYQRLVGAGSVQLMNLLGSQPLRGLVASSRVIPHESHATGSAVAYYSYLRACWPATSATGTLR